VVLGHAGPYHRSAELEFGSWSNLGRQGDRAEAKLGPGAFEMPGLRNAEGVASIRTDDRDSIKEGGI
jgi:hypothetical protein